MTPLVAALRDLSRRCEQAGSIPERIRPAELQLIDRAIRELQLVPETRSFRFYTRSLDAVVLLVPEGFGWRLWQPNSASEERPRATMWGNSRSYTPKDSEAETATLALLAATLLARACVAERAQ